MSQYLEIRRPVFAQFRPLPKEVNLIRYIFRLESTESGGWGPKIYLVEESVKVEDILLIEVFQEYERLEDYEKLRGERLPFKWKWRSHIRFIRGYERTKAYVFKDDDHYLEKIREITSAGKFLYFQNLIVTYHPRVGVSYLNAFYVNYMGFFPDRETGNITIKMYVQDVDLRSIVAKTNIPFDRANELIEKIKDPYVNIVDLNTIKAV